MPKCRALLQNAMLLGHVGCYSESSIDICFLADTLLTELSVNVADSV